MSWLHNELENIVNIHGKNVEKYLDNTTKLTHYIVHYVVSRKGNLTWSIALHSAKKKRQGWHACVCVYVYSKTPSGSLSTPAELPQFNWKMWTVRLRTEQLSSASRNQQCVISKTEDEFRGRAHLLIGPNDAEKSQKAQHVKFSRMS